MSNINELTAKLKATEQHAKRGWDEAHEQETRAETAEKQRDSWRTLAKQNIAEREKDIAALDESRQRIADLESKLSQSESWSVSAQNYIAELEARTLTVKLKQYDEFWIEHIAPGCPDGYAKGFIDGRNYGEKQIKTACAAAGIKLQIEGE